MSDDDLTAPHADAPVVEGVGPGFEPDLAALAVVEAELVDVERALERLDEGSYGTCEACGVALADEVLADAPATRFCATHQPDG
jgi:RNA polymerase-binding transcription factor DksA